MNRIHPCALGALMTVALLMAGNASAADPTGVRLNRTIATLAADQPVFGIFTGDFSLANARALARSELDFIFIDMEHTAFNIETLQTFLVGMTDKAALLENAHGQMAVTPLVRIPMNGRESLQWQVKQVLDAGAFGIVFPYVETRAEAENAVRAMRYPQRRGDPAMEPSGLRGSSPAVATWFWGTDDYSELADVWPLDPRGELLTVIQIESRKGVENIDAIASVPGISAIFIGPSDLSISYGAPNQRDDPEINAAIAKVLGVCKARNIPCGLTTSQETVEDYLKQGYRFVTVGYWDDAGISDRPATALGIARRVSGRAAD